MDLPMSWLKDFVNIDDITLDEFVDKMTMSGSNVETVKFIGHEITKVVVGKILKIENHPDADRLVVCKIDIGDDLLQIVTGADNIFEGAYVPVALHGATLADDLKIKTGKLRGVESQGMLCSVEELGYTKQDYPEAPEDGIYIFNEEVKLGDDALEILQMRDEVVEFELTSNRGDCNSIIGIAREVAATFSTPIKNLNIKVEGKINESIDELLKVRIESEKLCNRYVARVVKNIKIEDSPLWLRHRLMVSGVRPINNIVDITNYVMLELGQPMHAFDLSLVNNKEIIVRNARKDEKFTTLDKVERNLDETMLVIADDEKAIGIAGVMGGENSKVSPNASAILLESANFDATNIRLTSKKLGLRTDSSGKFEKGIDPNLALTAINRAAELIEKLGAGEIVSGIVDNYPNKRDTWEVPYSPDNINKLLGTNISSLDMASYLNKLEIKTNNNVATINTFRPDIKLEVDIAEEVARMYGYDNIKVTMVTGTPTVGKKTEKQLIEDIIKDTLAKEGLNEVLNYSFESPKVFSKLNIDSDDKLRETVLINNPLGEDFSIMRTSTLNGMLQSLSTNYNRRNKTAWLFEVSNIYIPKSLPLSELPDEIPILTLGMYGELDFYDIKGKLEVLFEILGINEVDFDIEDTLSFMNPGRTGKILLNDNYLGYVGEVHPQVLKNYEIGTRAYVAVIDLNIILKNATFLREFKPLAKFPSIQRDIAVIIKNNIMVKEIEKIIIKKGGEFVEKIALFDVYQGEQVSEGFKSVAYNITFRAEDRTLKDKEIIKSMDKIISTLENELDAQLRDK